MSPESPALLARLGLQRALGLGSYKTAWLILHKLRQAMVRPGRERLRGVVEIDETYWGAAESGGATGRLIYAAEQDGKAIAGVWPFWRRGLSSGAEGGRSGDIGSGGEIEEFFRVSSISRLSWLTMSRQEGRFACFRHLGRGR